MIKDRVSKIYKSRSVLWEMSIFKLKSKYAGSLLGIWWAVIAPLMLAISINIIFKKIFSVTIPNYTLFVLSGIIPWIFFSTCLTETTTCFQSSISIVRQAIFPREFIPVSQFLSNLLNFLIGLVFLLPLFIIANFNVISKLPFLLTLVILHSFFILGLSLLFASINVFLKDLNHFLSIGLMLWFWITPVFYSMQIVEYPYRLICLINPLTYFVISYQSLLFEAKVPALSTFIKLLLISLSFFLLGYVFFIKNESKILKRI